MNAAGRQGVCTNITKSGPASAGPQLQIYYSTDWEDWKVGLPRLGSKL